MVLVDLVGLFDWQEGVAGGRGCLFRWGPASGLRARERNVAGKAVPAGGLIPDRVGGSTLPSDPV